MAFTDKTHFRIKAGDGGPGSISFKRARKLPKLGPDGGDGGWGGNVYLIGNSALNSLCHISKNRRYLADDGEKGGTNDCNGANGKSLYVPLPLGTIIRDKETGEILGEITDHQQILQLCTGGKRGIGNLRFKSPNNRAPRRSTPGGEGEELFIDCELKIIAQVGLTGFPNAGKSTLFNHFCSGNSTIGAYPFTTLTPHIGVHDGEFTWSQKLTIADIPGIIEGAHEGKGLGHKFLKHITRTKYLLYVVDISDKETKDIKSEVSVLQAELEQFEPQLAAKPCIYAFNKIDGVSEEKKEAIVAELQKTFGEENSFFISASEKVGLEELSEALHKLCAPKIDTQIQPTVEPYDGTNMPDDQSTEPFIARLNKTLPFLQ